MWTPAFFKGGVTFTEEDYNDHKKAADRLSEEYTPQQLKRALKKCMKKKKSQPKTSELGIRFYIIQSARINQDPSLLGHIHAANRRRA